MHTEINRNNKTCDCEDFAPQFYKVTNRTYLHKNACPCPKKRTSTTKKRRKNKMLNIADDAEITKQQIENLKSRDDFLISNSTCDRFHTSFI